MKKQSDFLFIIIPSFVVILLWIVFTIFRSATSSTISETHSLLIQPISPNLDVSVITQLNKRKKISPNLDEVIQATTEEEENASPSSTFTFPPIADTEESSVSGEI